VKRVRVNGEIKARTVLVVGAEGDQLGEQPLAEALRIAAEAELDLVEVAPEAEPPVCRIVDYSRYRYELERKQKAARRNQVKIVVKEVRLRPKIGPHDLDWQLAKVRGHLDHGAKVKLLVFFRGREREFPQRGRDLLERIAEETGASVEQRPTMDGRSMVMVIAPRRSG
jgi:translation initiation factor IF-3